MSKQKISILQVTHKSGISKKTGREWEMTVAECILEQETSEGKQIIVGPINLPKTLKATTPGDYLAEFAISRSMEGNLEPYIVSLTPFGRPTAKPAAGAA
ncbi:MULTISPECIES: hypothetical protein [Burkholderia]|uniref:hypothetical protein n=1 Tax=Burkholderia TaxID=32008 RepID=UPI000753FB72|nr:MULTISPECIES: hypothetical protein [Burkholderia]AOJ69854.1 cellulose synthase [Burkholderia savannae]KVG41308.1 cellulose synthase [Burkholderia sp. MSMB0265]KVG84432.1 cellulose synthase [Burkholderia sp. MSMB2040]KVG95608.1 cellulose synthase [Burkholderia sp. MSMB2041]KVH01236.1 cellulose synthase [Burkholderia sp. MSMB2042]